MPDFVRNLSAARNIGARVGFTDHDAFGAGFVAAQTYAGCLDAPDWMPQGSARVHNTLRHYPVLSIALRDEPQYRRVGIGCDGPEPPTIREGFAT